MTEPVQPELFAPKPGDYATEVAWLEKFLLGGQIWFTASDILLAVQRPANDAGKRWLRNLASASSEIISGQKGYKHVNHATAEEVNHSANWLISQGKLMIKRGIGQRRYAHTVFG